MDILVQKNALKLIRQIVNRAVATQPIIPFRPQKAAFPSGAVIEQPFPRKAPEAEGISSSHILSFLTELRDDSTLDMHGIMILRNGSVIAESAFGAYKLDTWHITHSMCKSITGLAVGMLIDEGRLSLDDRIVKIFDKKAPPLAAIMQKNLTVSHLLTMTSGAVFNEAGSVTEEDWVKGFLESTLKSEPGHTFSYNSMNSYMLSAIIKQITGQGLAEYLGERLFGPLGIKNFFWEKCPNGIEKGGWGLYICPEDMAKIGQLVLQRGLWNGKRLISEKWISESTAAKVKTPDTLGDFDYGYHIWTGRKQNSFLFNGMFGQNVIGFPDSGILIVSNAGNDEMFQQSSYFNLLNKYFGPDVSFSSVLPADKQAHKRLLRFAHERGLPAQNPIAAVFKRNRNLKQCMELSGKAYVLDNLKSRGIGFLPVIAQAVQNNFTSGLKGISFSLENRTLIIKIDEENASFSLPVGFSEPEYATADIYGEPYIIGTTGRFAENEDGDTVLKLRFSFIEIANSREIKLIFRGDKIKVFCSETPGVPYLRLILSSIEKNFTNSRIFGSVISKVDPDYLEYKIGRVMEPLLEGVQKTNR